MSKLSAARLRKVLSYDPASGRFTWLVRTSNRVRVGDEAGCADPGHGYRLIGVDGRVYFACNLAWLYMTGEWPALKGVDHKDGDRLNDRWSNLRKATPSQQQFNRGAQANNTSGFKGAHRHTQSDRWLARICKDGKQTYIGIYDTPEEAHAAYVEAAKRLHGDFARVE